MRVLLYVEPHPIRDTMVHFDGVAKNFIPLLTSPLDFDVRMFANEATFAAISTELEPHVQKLIRTTQREEEYLNDLLMRPWGNDGLSVWLDLMAGRGEAAQHHLETLRRIWSVFPFEIIVHWGENGAVTRFLDEFPVTRVAMELGCSRPPFYDSIVMDIFGANGSAIVPRMTVEDLRHVVDDRAMSRHEALYGFSVDVSAPGYYMQFERLPSELNARLKNKQIAFLPLQLFDDANLTRFSPYETITDVVLDVVPKLSDAGYLTIIKPHPASKHRKGALLENSFARDALGPWSDSILWCDEDTRISNSRFFSMADLVVTVNSSVGFEALYFDKTVVVLGDAVFKPKDMFPSLNEVLSGEFNRTAYLDAAGVLRRFMFGGYLQPRKILHEASVFYQYLSLSHSLSQNLKADPVGYARGIWRSQALSQQAGSRSRMLFGITRPGIGEFAHVQTVASPKETKAELEDLVPWKNGSKLPLANINRIKAHWVAEKTGEWIKENWASANGRSEVVKIGGIVDPDYYCAKYPDIRQNSTDPVEHFALHGIFEGRSPQSKLPITSLENVLSQLLFCAEQSALDSYTLSSTADVNHDENCAFRIIFDRLRTHVSGLDIGSFLDWLSDAWLDKIKREKIIRTGELVDADYYLRRYKDVAEKGIDPIHHYAFYGVTEGRSPNPGVEGADADAFLALLQSSVENVENLHQSLSHPLPDNVEVQRSQKLQNIRDFVSKSKNRIAVVVHLYYTDIVSDILERLRAIEEPFDLLVTVPDWGTRRTMELVRMIYPDASFYNAANRGRDVGPFVDLLPILIEKDYDAVLKLQTKRGYFRAGKMVPELGEIWRQETIDAMLGSPERVKAILEALRQNSDLNMVGPQPFLLSLDQYPYHDGGVLADSIIGSERHKNDCFFAGTMFWVRPACLKSLTKLNITNFDPESGASDGALAHLVERMFGKAASNNGGMIALAPVDPKEPLIFERVSQHLTIDAYLTEAANALRDEKRQKIAGGLTSGELMWGT
jgi:hypothetical protein